MSTKIEGGQAKPDSRLAEHSFRLILSGAEELTPEIADRLASVIDDAVIGQRAGVIYATFDREAVSREAAIQSAIGDIEKADVGLKVVRVEHETAV